MSEFGVERDAPIRQHGVLVADLVEHFFLNIFVAQIEFSLLCVLMVQLRGIVNHCLRDVVDAEQDHMNWLASQEPCFTIFYRSP